VRRVLACLLAALPLLGACGSDDDGGTGPVTLPVVPRISTSPWFLPPLSGPPALFPVSGSASAAPSSAATPAPAPVAGPAATSRGWEVTVYYTAVERFHHGDPVAVTGCPQLACKNGDRDLGSYPADFVQAVKDEGTGRTSKGTYLNWSYDTGYWLDTATRDSYGHPLVAFVSAAADPVVLPRGTRFTIADCGRADDGSALPGKVCGALRSEKWLITDEFTPGLGGSKHIDAYIGPETGEHFTDSDWYITLTDARITLG
jgi:hypothetical protein